MKPNQTISLLLLCAGTIAQAGAQSPVDYVSTLVGTQSKHSLSTGNTYPQSHCPGV